VKRTLGFRAEAKQIHWAVVEGTRENPILVDHGIAAAPVDLTDAPALSWYSSRVKHIIQTYQPSMGMIRTAESIARGPGHCDLIVELTDQGGTWGVETFTQKPGETRRAKCKNTNWKDGLSLDDAYEHLEGVFETLLE
jgi:hypothetical protein